MLNISKEQLFNVLDAIDDAKVLNNFLVDVFKYVFTEKPDNIAEHAPLLLELYANLDSLNQEKIKIMTPDIIPAAAIETNNEAQIKLLDTQIEETNRKIYDYVNNNGLKLFKEMYDKVSQSTFNKELAFLISVKILPISRTLEEKPAAAPLLNPTPSQPAARSSHPSMSIRDSAFYDNRLRRVGLSRPQYAPIQPPSGYLDYSSTLSRWNIDEKSDKKRTAENSEQKGETMLEQFRANRQLLDAFATKFLSKPDNYPNTRLAFQDYIKDEDNVNARDYFMSYLKSGKYDDDDSVRDEIKEWLEEKAVTSSELSKKSKEEPKKNDESDEANSDPDEEDNPHSPSHK